MKMFSGFNQVDNVEPKTQWLKSISGYITQELHFQTGETGEKRQTKFKTRLPEATQ